MAVATYQSSYTAVGSYDSNTGILSISRFQSEDTLLTGGSDGVFQVDDSINILFGGTFDFGYAPYVGSTADGALLYTGGVGYLFFTTSPNYAVGDEVSISQSSFTTCFLEGTRIACPQGERAVEEIAVGDLVLTASGEARPVRWVGRQSLRLPFADRQHSFPIRISAGALGGGLPRRDLFVSPSHAMLVEGVLVQAQALVNSTSIAQVRPPKDQFTYYHLEFEAHELVLAEGAPSESFLDSNAARARFDNHAEFTALYGADAPIAAASPLPRVTASRQLPQRLRKLLAAAGADAAAHAA